MSARQPIKTAPKDGTEILLPLECNVRAYWCTELETWVLSSPLHIESIVAPQHWHPVFEPTQSCPSCHGTGRTPEDAST